MIYYARAACPIIKHRKFHKATKEWPSLLGL
nr:MAG TPA: hypothetical protein [Caudoviricetes sp.]